MTWFRIDDKFHDHAKVRKLGKERTAAVGVWTLCGSWSADTLSDGFVPSEIVLRFDPKEKLARRLVEVGLWDELERDGEHGYQFHQWDQHQPTRAEVHKRRDDTRKRVEEWRRRKALQEESEQDGNGVTNASQVALVTQLVTPPPTRPDPTRPLKDKETPSLRSGEPRKRGTRISDDFTASPEMVAWARDRVPQVDGRIETEKFINYWQAKTGKDATKLDWVATWRNWMLTAGERRPTSRASPGHVPFSNPTDQSVYDEELL